MPVSTLSVALLEEARESSSQALRGSAANRIYAGLRAKILSLELKPDATVARGEVAEAFEVPTDVLVDGDSSGHIRIVTGVKRFNFLTLYIFQLLNFESSCSSW